MRGKVPRFLPCSVYRRITPAYAGKSRVGFQKHGRFGDHPRLCGEKAIQDRTTERVRGSPPPMRGKVLQSRRRYAFQRITPAYAGKSVLCSTQDVQRRDHPRLCGEKDISAQRLYSASGSPPPMRGKAIQTTTWTKLIRITPAYAGKRKIADFYGVSIEDHPRLCGEKLLRWLVVGINHRITPAYAGKSCSVLDSAFFIRDHPRLCGEKSCASSSTIWNVGSPPPMRGKELLPHYHHS